MATVFGLPMIKLGGLVVRTLTKPLAKVVKTRSKVHPGLNAVCNWLGQGQHRVMIKFHMGFRGIQNYKIKDIPEDQAVEKGADLIGEIMIFSVAVAVASMEYTRSSAKSKENERKQEELKRKAEQELEERFEKLEMQVIWLETKLAELGHIVEHDLDKRIEEAVSAAAVEQLEDDLQQIENRRVRDGTGASSTSSSVWNATYSAITGIFR